MKVVMIPWLAYGHINGYLELAKKLAKRNFQISFCSTPINLASIEKRVTDQFSLSITLVPFHLQSTPELPPHYHTTNGLPSHLHLNLGKALQTAGSDWLTEYLKISTPDFIIYDYNNSWAPAIASSYNIKAVEYMITGTANVTMYSHFFQHPGTDFPYPAIQPQGYNARGLRELLKIPFEKTHKRFGEPILKSSKMILFNTFRGLEGKYIDYLSEMMGKKIVPVGPIVQEVATDDTTDEYSEIMRWLDEKGESSTVFVAFGSECFPSKQEMEEIAHGLELSKVNFIWVVRCPQGENEEEKPSIKEVLPEGFLERVRGGDTGLVVEGWAPQAKILAHPNTGGFLSHCGWNSTMESLYYGVPVIAVPMSHDQPVNARLMEDVGLGVEVKREEDGRLDREDIARVIRKVVVEKDGEKIRTKARELQKTIKSEGEKQIDNLVQELNQLLVD